MIYHSTEIPAKTLISQRTAEVFGTHHTVSKHAGFKKLFSSLEILPPGRKSSSPHYPTTKEEIIYILEGEPTVLINDTARKAKAGDFVCFPPDAKNMHQIFNETAIACKFIVMSAGSEQDETIYF